jgi:hypothetical protein
MTQFSRMLDTLVRHGVEFVIIGGVAATAHGSSLGTFDLDVCYRRDPENLKRLAGALQPLHPRLRGAPDNLRFRWDAETLRQGLNFTLMTDLGELDLLGEVAGVGSFEQARSDARVETVFGVPCAVLSLPALIASKRAAGRVKDLQAVFELEALWEAQRDDE